MSSLLSARPLSLLALATLIFSAPAIGESKTATPTKPDGTPVTAQETARGAAYYHLGLAHMYEDMAANTGRQDYADMARSAKLCTNRRARRIIG